MIIDGDSAEAAVMHERAVRLLNGTAEAANPHVMPGLGRLADH